MKMHTGWSTRTCTIAHELGWNNMVGTHELGHELEHMSAKEVYARANHSSNVIPTFLILFKDRVASQDQNKRVSYKPADERCRSAADQLRLTKLKKKNRKKTIDMIREALCNNENKEGK